jgi:hypothetical protein
MTVLVCECVCGAKMVPPARFQRATFRLGISPRAAAALDVFKWQNNGGRAALELVHVGPSNAKLRFGVRSMQPNKVYDEVIEFIASSSPQNVIAFRPSEEAKAHVAA